MKSLGRQELCQCRRCDMAQLNESHGKIKAPPNTQDVGALRDYVANLANLLAKLTKDLDFIINGNLDVKNIRANSITADRLEVDELSAISANLGHIIAGIIESVEIYGSKIATSRDSYPRAEMSETGALFRVMLSPTAYLEMMPDLTLSGSQTPAIKFVKDGASMVFGYGAANSGQMGIRTNDTTTIIADNGLEIFSQLITLSWSHIMNFSTGRTLQQDINELTDAIDSLTMALNNKATKGVSTGSVGGHNHGIPDGTVLMTNTGTVTWSTAGGHSHSQA